MLDRDDNLQVNGARKVWRQLRREDVVVARCTVAQLMREMGIAGVVGGTPNRTTTGEETAGPTDLVARLQPRRQQCYGW